MKTIKSSNGFDILVDDEDFDWINSYSWTVGTHRVDKYAKRSIPHPTRKGAQYTVRLHRFLMGLQIGDRRVVDHINRNTLDNRRCNLRVCSHAQNTRNSPLSKSNTSGFKGVSYNKAKRKWTSHVSNEGKKLYLGSFDTAELAYEAYKAAAIEIYGEFASFPSGAQSSEGGV